MEMKISEKLIRTIKENDLTIEEYFILHSKYFKNGLLTLYRPGKYLYTKLMKRGLLTQVKAISKDGVALVEKLDQTDAKIKKKEKEQFEEFWKAYPASDGFAHFKPTTSNKRGSKHTAKLAFKQALQSIKFKDLLQALINDVEQRKRQSLLTGKNELKYMVGATRWLTEEHYETWKEQTKENPTTTKRLPDVE